MKINTKNTRDMQGRKNSQPARRKAPARKHVPQKISRSRVSKQQILSSLRWICILGGIVLAAVLIASIWNHTLNSERFHVRNIAIYGCKQVNPERVEQIVQNHIPENILDIDLAQLKEQIEAFKWIRQVEIRRVLPSGLIIKVRERVPSVILEMHGELMIADNDGILLDRYERRYGKLDVPVLKGVVGKDTRSYESYQQENSARIRNALNMLDEIASEAPSYIQKISEVDISDRNNLKIMLVDDTIEIYLGNRDYLNRLRAFMKSGKYPELKRKNMPIAVVDLRFDDRIIYRRSRVSSNRND